MKICVYNNASQKLTTNLLKLIEALNLPIISYSISSFSYLAATDREYPLNDIWVTSDSKLMLVRINDGLSKYQSYNCTYMLKMHLLKLRGCWTFRSLAKAIMNNHHLKTPVGMV